MPPIQSAMRNGARCRKAKRAGGHAFRRQPRHFRTLFRCGHRMGLGCFTHHMHAQGRMRDHGRDVYVIRPRIQCIHIFGEAFPIPGQAFGQHNLWQILHAFHQLHEHIAPIRPARREAHAAIAKQRRGHAIDGRRKQPAAPSRLGIVMRVDIHKARRDDQPLGIDFIRTARRNFTDFYNTAITNGDIGFIRRRAGAIHQRATTNDQACIACHGGFLQVFRMILPRCALAFICAKASTASSRANTRSIGR